MRSEEAQAYIPDVLQILIRQYIIPAHKYVGSIYQSSTANIKRRLAFTRQA
jgi:hypothetical protein